MTGIEHIEPEPLDVDAMNDAACPIEDCGISDITDDYGAEDCE